MASVKFYINKDKANWGEEETLYARFTHGGDNIKLFPDEPIKLNPRQWNGKAQKADGKTTAILQLNSRLMKEQLRITEAWATYSQAAELNGYIPSAKAFRDYLKGGKVQTTQRAQTLIDLLHLYLQTGGMNLAESTKKNYFSTASQLQRFAEATGHPLTTENLDMAFFTSFTAYLSASGVKNQSTNIYMTKIVRALRYLTRKGGESLRKRIPLDYLHVEPLPQGKKGERDHITEEEAEFLNNLQNLPYGVRAVRDLYLFICFAGPRFSDAVALSRDANIITMPGEYGPEKYLSYTQQKIKYAEPVIVPLNGICEAIVSRNLTMTGKVLPQMNNMTANRRMRILFRKLKAFYTEVSENEARFLKGRRFKSQDAENGAKWCGFPDGKQADPEQLAKTLAIIKGLLKTREKVDYCGGERTVTQYERWQKLTIHTSRHSFGTLLDAKGADMEVIRQMMGHSTVATTAIYRHRDKQKVLNQVSGMLNKPLMKVG